MRSVLLLFLLCLAGCVDEEAPVAAARPETAPDPALMAHLEALAIAPELRFETSHGTIRALLHLAWLPNTVAHIGDLAQDGFYNNTIIHRVVDDFVIQGGDPTGTGEGGSGPLGTPNPIPLEIHPGLQFQTGAIGLARWTEDTGDSQWFITEQPALHLDDPQGQPNELLGPYALFGQVFEGMDVVRAIAKEPVLPGDRPVDDVEVHSALILPPPHDVDLLGLVMDVTPNFEMGIGVGELEVPRFVVAGHPAIIRFTSEDPDCSMGQFGDHENWTPIAGEVCVYEQVRIHEAGSAWVVGTDVVRDSTVHTVEYEVLPWHDAYAPFTGTVMNAS